MNQIPAYPLRWPDGWQKTAKRRSGDKFQVTPAQARDDLFEGLRRLGATNVIVSSNVPLKASGIPFADGMDEHLQDPGVAVYFQRKGKPQVIACDTYLAPVENLRAIYLCIEAMRTMDRHGASTILEKAFTGFTALPPKMEDRKWWEVLGVSPNATTEQVEAAYREGARRYHPDLGGDAVVMQQINRARDEHAAQAR